MLAAAARWERYHCFAHSRPQSNAQCSHWSGYAACRGAEAGERGQGMDVDGGGENNCAPWIVAKSMAAAWWLRTKSVPEEAPL